MEADIELNITVGTLQLILMLLNLCNKLAESLRVEAVST